MYEEIIKTVNLTSDEVDILITLLESEIGNSLSLGEELTVCELLHKIK